MSARRSPALQAGDELAGRYRLQQRLGHGAVGEVWQALDLTLDRRVAVKTLLTNQTDDHWQRALARFRREARAVARLNHRHIAAVHDLVEHQDPPFLVLELLAGPDLAAHLRDHPGGLPIDMVLEYGAQTAEGLAAAHAAGVIHRDIKPHNLILDGSGTVKICDFGIARLDGATVGLTLDGTILGTPAYMAPEQMNDKPVTHASDVYALGATLFHLLTGCLLFPDAGMYAAVFEDPPLPSSLRPAIPKTLDTYLLTLLAKDPSARPSASSVPAALRAATVSPRRGGLPWQARAAMRAPNGGTVGMPTVRGYDLPVDRMDNPPVHFIWMLDCSHSMSMNGKITHLNFAVREAIPEMIVAAEDHSAAARLVIQALTFNSGARWHIEAPVDIRDLDWKDVDAYGSDGARDMGAAFQLVARALHVPPMPQRGRRPVLALVSDGSPTDDWRSGLRELAAAPWGRQAMRVAVAVGEGADLGVLKEFLGDDEREPLRSGLSPQQMAATICWDETVVKPWAWPDDDARTVYPIPSRLPVDDGDDVW
ncbi:protein kinase [Streptomyces abikoensis]|uniref:protein kinase domain-containing protein n=1 Tax=Streptomyces abikoensis TaxID=97398 RepID=UPI0033E4FCA9